ncbi:MAG: CDP-alcohol phosphatidyltransferase family protein [Planctomycetota bacterium]|nr:CDP-alcohol phosphatidyltransferase family protein [Planctomycetota bacterium]
MVVAERTRRNRVRLPREAGPLEPVETPKATVPQRHPISRWYLIPLARIVVAGLTLSPLTRSRIRPSHVTLAGLGFAAAGVGVLLWRPDAAAIAAIFVLAAWLCDRIDGMLARLQVSGSAWGGWLDSNVDELVDVALQTAVAVTAARLTGSQWPWLLLVAFLAGKYLFMFGLSCEEQNDRMQTPDAAEQSSGKRGDLLRRLYHFPANADVRVHFLVVALFFGCFTAELAVVAVYYNLRWIARYPLVARRLGGWQ